MRELEHVLEQAMILGDSDILGLRHLPEEMRDSPSPSRPVDLRDAVRQFSRDHILDVLARVGFNKREAARRLGISLASLYRKLNVEPPAGDDLE